MVTHVGRTRASHKAPRGQRRGFTLIELLVVLAIVALLMTIAAPRYLGSIEVAKETVLIDNLKTVRTTIDQFHGDMGRYPKDLDELVARKYLRAAPFDPFTESAVTWRLIAPENGTEGVMDIKSIAPGITRDGRLLQEL
jgi:general secretion pathway protein G